MDNFVVAIHRCGCSKTCRLWYFDSSEPPPYGNDGAGVYLHYADAPLEFQKGRMYASEIKPTDRRAREIQKLETAYEIEEIAVNVCHVWREEIERLYGLGYRWVYFEGELVAENTPDPSIAA